MSQKACKGCGSVKDLADFYRHPRMSDGRLNSCKLCHIEAVRTRRLRDVEAARARANQLADTPERRAYRLEAAKIHKQRHPDRSRARNAVSNAVRDGRLIRQPCEDCGDPKSEGHHEDYSRPLDVRWLCRHCLRRAEGRLVT